MKIICLQEKLKRGLEIVERIVGKNITLPILQNILLETEKGGLKISSTDLEMGISTWVTGKVEEPGSITIPARLLSNIIYNLPQKKISLRVKDTSIFLLADEYRATIFGEKSEQFPLIPKIKKRTPFSLSSREFVRALSLVVKSVSLSDSRPEISGVFIQFRKKLVSCVATDSFRLSEVTLPFVSSLPDTSFILPARTAQEIVRIFSVDAGPESVVEVTVENNQALFEMGETQIVTRLIEGEYPHYQEIIPKEFELEGTFDREFFLHILKTSSFFSGRNNEVSLAIDPVASLLSISARNSSSGESVSQIPFSKFSKKKKLTLVCNYKYLLDGLSDIKSKEVMLKANTEINPVLFRPENGDPYVYLIMPIRAT